MMPLQSSLTIERVCELARVSRASFYRSLQKLRPAEEETEVRSAIQQIAGTSPPRKRPIPTVCTPGV
jgi:hypothetical protein